MDVFSRKSTTIEATKRQIIYENELVYFMKRYDFYDMIDSVFDSWYDIK
jgi:hypothetical protein